MKPIAEQIGTHYNPKTIKRRLRRVTEYVEVRRPGFRPNKTAQSWHADGIGGKQAHIVILWSNRESTEVKRRGRGNHKVLTFPPGAVVFVWNKLALHRYPRRVSADRWFARAVIQ